MPIQAAVAGKAGIHQPQTVEQLCACAEGTADTRHTGALMQRQRSRDIQYLVYAGFGCLHHSSACVGRQGFEVAARPLGIQHAQRKGGFTGAGHARNSDDLSERNIDINIFQVVDFRSTDQHFIDHCFTPNTESPILSFRKRPAVNLSLCQKASIPHGAVSR